MSKYEFSKEVTDGIIALRKQGKSWQAIGNHYGIHRRTVYRHYCITVQGTQPRAEWTPERCQKLQDSRKAGDTWSETARKLGIKVIACKRKYYRMQERGGACDAHMVRPKMEDRKAPPAVLPQEIRFHTAARRGYDIPPSKEPQLTELLLKGVPLQQAYQSLGVPVS